MPAYSRFWEIHLTADDGWYDFVANIGSQGRYQTQKIRGGQLLNLISPEDAPAPTWLTAKPTPMALPQTGYIASAVKIGEVDGAVRSEDVRRIIEWVNDPEHIGKIRVNSHGMPGGRLQMNKAPFSGDATQTMAARLAFWLAANGLSQHGSNPLWRSIVASVMRPTGVATICLAICRGGVAATVGSELRSAVDQLVDQLKTLGLRDIYITGSTDDIRVRPSEEAMERTLKVQSSMDVRRFEAVNLSTDELRALVKGRLPRLHSTALARLNRTTLEKVDVLPHDLLVDFWMELLVAEALVGSMAQYPADSLPGQWGTMVGPEGNQRWRRLTKFTEKVCDSS